MTTTKELTAPAVTGEPTPAPAPPPSLFSKISKGRQGGPRATMIYGTGGIGKTTMAAQAPAPIFVPTEDGLRNIDCHSFPLARSLKDVRVALDELRTQPHDYRTVVLDSLDWCEQLIWRDVVEWSNDGGKKIKSIEEIGYGKGYVMALSRWRFLCDRLDELRTQRGMSVVLLAHAQILQFASPESESFDRYVPKLHKAASALMIEWCDDVLFATYEVFTRKIEDRIGERNIGIGSGDRILRIVERPFCIAKNRLGLVPEIEKVKLDWNEYAKLWPENRSAT